MPALSSTSNRSEATDRVIRRKRKAAQPSRPAPARQPGPISDAENRKIEWHKRTRSYYKAYQAGFQENPKVKKAARQINNPKTRVRGLRALERERRRGPDKLANASYGMYLTHLWDRVKDEYPDSKDRPKAKIDYKIKPGPTLAFVFKGHNKVHYSPALAREFMGPGKINGAPNPVRGTAKTTPLHEWTHTRQPKGVLKRVRVREGGAQANEKRIAKKLGLPYFASSAEYEKWAARMRRKYGEDWIARGQYKGGK